MGFWSGAKYDLGQSQCLSLLSVPSRLSFQPTDYPQARNRNRKDSLCLCLRYAQIAKVDMKGRGRKARVKPEMMTRMDVEKEHLLHESLLW